MVDPAPGSWRWRILVAEAMILLSLARCLVAAVRLGRWRWLLGEPVDQAARTAPPPSRAQTLAAIVNRGATRLPFECKCLPRAMALHWMLRRRGVPCQLVITVLDPAQRGADDNLHAWVEAGAAVLIGAIDRPFVPLVRFGSTNR